MNRHNERESTFVNVKRQAAIGLRVALGLCRTGIPKGLLWYWGGIGDELLCSAILHEWARRGNRRMWMMSDHAELFAGNPDVPVVIPLERELEALFKRHGVPIHRPVYAGFTDESRRREISPSMGIIAKMCSQVGIEGEVALRPYLYLTERERRRGCLYKSQICIQSSCLGAIYAHSSKDWFPERFQSVVDELKSNYTVIQLGTPSDPPLNGVVDLRGRTSLREAASLLANSLCFVGLVGFLMHLARAVECHSVIVYGGRELPWQSGYICNENVAAAVDCSPCWVWGGCPRNRECMQAITAEDVIAAIGRAVSRHGAALEVERVTVPREKTVTPC